MDHLENDLKRALARTDPPEGFADRVLAQIERQNRRQPSRDSWWRRLLLGGPRPQWALATAAVVLSVGVVQYERQERQRQTALEAREQLRQALRIAGSKLQYAHQKVVTLHEEDSQELRNE